eukprot:scpid85480/ scgid3193/ Ras-related protein Rab-15
MSTPADPDGLQYPQGTLKNYDILLKSMLIGDSGVGKSCFMARFVGGHVNNTHIATIGIDFKMQTVTVDGVRVRMQIWDTAGQERFNSLTDQYYKRVNGIFLVYDITDVTSFHNVRRWMDSISEKADRDVRTMIIANKYDLARLRVVSRKEGERLATEYGVPYVEASAMEGINVQEAVHKLCRLLLRKVKSIAHTHIHVSTHTDMHTLTYM